MKAFLNLFLCLALAVSLTACDSGGGGDDNDNPGGLGTMEAMIDGTQWNAANATATLVSAFGISSLTIAGADASANAMTISLIGAVGEASYSLGSNTLGSMSYVLSGSVDAYVATTGTVTIETINDDKVEGTFSFEGTRFSDNATVMITSGSFNVGYGPSIF